MSLSFPKSDPVATYVYSSRVRYYDVDAMGRVHHSVYFKYMENARTEWLRAFEVTYKKIEDSGVFMPVTSIEAKYKVPLNYDELFYVNLSIFEIPSTRMPIFSRITNEQQQVVFEGRVELCFINATTLRPQRSTNLISEFVDAVINPNH